MVSRYVELEEPIKATLALLNKDLPVLTEAEWKMAKEFTTVLEPFEDVTNKISGEHYATESQVIVYVNGLARVCKKMEKEQFSKETKDLVKSLLNGLNA